MFIFCRKRPAQIIRINIRYQQAVSIGNGLFIKAAQK